MTVRRIAAHKIRYNPNNGVARGRSQQERYCTYIEIHGAVFVCKSVGLKYQPHGECDSGKGKVCHQESAASSEKIFRRAYGKGSKKHRRKTYNAQRCREKQVHIGQKDYQRINRTYCGREKNSPTARRSFHQKTCRRQHQKVDQQIYHQQYINIYYIAHRAPPETV